MGLRTINTGSTIKVGSVLGTIGDSLDVPLLAIVDAHPFVFGTSVVNQIRCLFGVGLVVLGIRGHTSMPIFVEDSTGVAGLTLTLIEVEMFTRSA